MMLSSHAMENDAKNGEQEGMMQNYEIETTLKLNQEKLGQRLPQFY